MAYLNRHSISSCVCAARVRRARLVLFFLAIVFGPISSVLTAPVTFRFDATITQTLASDPFDLPFSYQVADVVSGKFTFEPSTSMVIGDNAIKANQTLGLEFIIDGIKFGTSTYSIQLVDDSPIADAQFDEADSMTIGCSPSWWQSCTPDLITLPGGDPFSIGPEMRLMGDVSVYRTLEISSDPSVWNSLLFERILVLGFRGQGTGSALLYASLGDFTAIPEPGSLLLVITLVICIGMLLAKKLLLRKVIDVARSF